MENVRHMEVRAKGTPLHEDMPGHHKRVHYLQNKHPLLGMVVPPPMQRYQMLYDADGDQYNAVHLCNNTIVDVHA